MDPSGVISTTTAASVEPQQGIDQDTLTLSLTLPLVFFGTAVVIVTICVCWHGRADATDTSARTSSDNTSHRPSFTETFSFTRRSTKTENRASIRSDIPLHEEAIPNDFIPPVRTAPAKHALIGPANLPGQVNISLSETAEHFQPHLSTVTEENSSARGGGGGGERNLAYTRSDPYMFDERNANVPIPAFHLASWLLQNTDRSQRILDTREVRSDPHIVFGPPKSVGESSEMSTNPTAASKSDYSVESSFTSGSRGLHKSPFNPSQNSPMTANSYELADLRFEAMRHAITREGAPDQMASESDISLALSSNLSHALTSFSNLESLPASTHVSMTSSRDVVRYLEPDFRQYAKRQSSYGSSTAKIETSNETMVLYDSGLRAPPGSLKDHHSTSFISQADSLPYPQPQLEQVVASYNELHQQYHSRYASLQRELYPQQLFSADNSLQPQVGSSNTTARSQRVPDWDKYSMSSHAESENVMLAGGPLPLRPPTSVPRRHEQSYNSDSDQSIARKRPRASSAGQRHEALAMRKRTMSQDTPSSSQSMDWDAHNPSPVFGPPLLNSTDLSQLRAQAYGLPVLARKQYWV